jgi:hypothetical protein
MIVMSPATALVVRTPKVAPDAGLSTAGLAEVLKVCHRLQRWMFDSYRPELHYMRGPGPKWREKHAHAGAAHQ